MAEEIKTVIVLGGRGNLGPYLVSSLSKSGFAVTVLSRSSVPSSIDTVPVLQSDYTFESLVNAFHGQDAVICAIPPIHIVDPRRIIDAAIVSKVKRILPNEYGTDTSSDGLGEMAPFFQANKDLVAYLKQKQAESLSWTALCTGAWIDYMLLEGQGLLGLDIKTKTGTLFGSGDQMFTASTLKMVGDAAAAVLLHPTETKNQYVHVESFNTNQNMICQTIERVSGSKLRMDNMSVAELQVIGKKQLEEGSTKDAYYKLVTAWVYSGNKAINFPEKAEHWHGLLGLDQEETVDEMIGRVLATVPSVSD